MLGVATASAMHMADAARPIFVIGYMHSGTTLVSDILKKHPRIYGGRGESKFFDLLPVLTKTFPELSTDDELGAFAMTARRIIVEKGFTLMRVASGELPVEKGGSPDARRFVERYVGPRSHIAVIRRVYEDLAREGGHSQWLENTPSNIFFVDEIRNALPRVRFVEVVRDGRDILASKKVRTATVRSGRYEGNLREKKLEKAYDPLWDALAWKAAVVAGERAAQHSDVYTVRYEDLVVEPERVVPEVCRFLELEFLPSMLDVEWVNPADVERSGDPGISNRAVGRWRSTLSAPELLLIQRAAGRQLEANGYALAPSPLSAWLKMPPIVALSGFRLLLRLLRRWRMGGAPFVRSVVRSYWSRITRLSGK